MAEERLGPKSLEEPGDAALAKLRDAAANDDRARDVAVSSALAWSAVLPTSDRELLVDDLAHALEVLPSTGDSGPVVQLLREWEATAEIHADPVLARRLSTPIDVDAGTN